MSDVRAEKVAPLAFYAILVAVIAAALYLAGRRVYRSAVARYGQDHVWKSIRGPLQVVGLVLAIGQLVYATIVGLNHWL